MRWGARRRRLPQEPGYWEKRLLGFLDDPGCPVCRDIAGGDRSYFFWFFHEQYSYPHTLDALARSLGFCRAHATYLSHSSLDPGPLTFVHGVLCGRAVGALSGSGSRRSRGSRETPSLGPHGLCPACQDREGWAGRAAYFLARGLEDPSALARYGRPGVLCFPHLSSVSRFVSMPTLARLLEVHQEAGARAGRVLEAGRGRVCQIPPDARGGLIEALAPALWLSVGHDRDLGAFPPPRRPVEGEGAQDPVERLRSALRAPDACPVCLEVRRAWMEWVAWLGEALARGWQVEDLLPICPEHVWPTVHLGGKPLAAAAARKSLGVALHEGAIALRALNPPADKPRGILRRVEGALLRGRGPRLAEARASLARPWWCPVCRRLEEARDRTLLLLLALLGEGRNRAALEVGHGLCMGHLSRALALGAPAVARSFLLESEAAKLRQLHWELEEAQRKKSWTTRPEAQGAEASAWRRALWKFSGSLIGTGDEWTFAPNGEANACRAAPASPTWTPRGRN